METPTNDRSDVFRNGAFDDGLWHAHWIDPYGFEDQTRDPMSHRAAKALADRLARNASVGRVWLRATDGKEEAVLMPEKRVT